MVFVRIKKVKDKDYAYLVENKWNKGKVKQKTVKYLGRAHKHKAKKVSSFEKSNPLSSVLSIALQNAGFDDNLQKDGVKVDAVKGKVRKGRNEAAIILNEGILTSHTVTQLLNYVPEEEERPGMKLANILSATGISVDNECFINLYKVLHDT